MNATIPYDPRRFRTAAAHYLAGRPPYADLLIRRVAAACGLQPDSRVLDLGCGPGPLAVAFARLAGEVVAVDPEPEMLRAAAANAAAAGVAIRLRQGSSYDLDASLGNFRLVAIGRAFHWMQRADTLARLARLVEPDGAVALFADRHPDVPDNRWRQDYEALVGRYVADDSVHRLRKSADWVRHEAVLLDSPFSQLERMSVIERRRVPVDSLVHRVRSMSTTSEDRLGPRTEALAEEIRAAMSRLASDGLIIEVVESEALLARRPGAA
ncbi:MAG TPA: class I SAM-dependent methyltransferase [Candidatus Sulfotelmatobacter sp.]|nr:class I SAM-dependent methyltransferase [Candidatus Sulfotelmatobacter sp.]